MDNITNNAIPYFPQNNFENDDFQIDLTTLFFSAVGFTLLSCGTLLYKSCRKPNSPNETEEKLKKLGYFKASGFNGKSSIYLNPDKPQRLIKHPGLLPSWNPKERSNQANTFREFIEEKNFTELVIPQAEAKDDYLVEEKLPLHHNYKEIMGDYIEQPHLFDQSVEEFTHFLFSVNFSDLDKGKTPFSAINKGQIARFDNAVPFVRECKGKIGLVDLEHFSVMTEPPSIEHVMKCCKTAIAFFPYHFDIILKAGLDLFPELSQDELQIDKNHAVSFFNEVYIRHKEFLFKKKISLANPFEFPTLSEETLNRLELKLMSKVPNKEFQKDFFRSVINEVDTFNKKRINYAISKLEKPNSLPELLNMRTCIFSRVSVPLSETTMYDKDERLLSKKIEGLIGNQIAQVGERIEYAEELMSCVYDLLIEENIIGGFHALQGKKDCLFF